MISAPDPMSLLTQDLQQKEYFCYCLRVQLPQVIKRWQEGGYQDIDAFMQDTKIGTVCTSCGPNVRVLLTSLATAALPGLSGQKIVTVRSRVSPLSYWKRVKRFIRKRIVHYAGMPQQDFFTCYRLDQGYQSFLCLNNRTHPDFVRAAVDMRVTCRVYQEDGTEAFQDVRDLKADAATTVDVGARLQSLSRPSRYGLIHVTLAPLRSKDVRRWRVGTVRPYVAWEKNGRSLTIHEKSLVFDTPRVLPGVVTHPGQKIFLLVSSIADAPGRFELTMVATSGKTIVSSYDFLPHATQLIEIPSQLDGAPIQQVSAFSTMALSGYQLTQSTSADVVSVQHLVKEGN